MQGIITDYDIYRIEDGSEVLVETTDAEHAKAGDIFDKNIEYIPLYSITGGDMLNESFENVLVKSKGNFNEVVSKPYGPRDIKDIKVMKHRDFQKKLKEEAVKGKTYSIDGRAAVCTQSSKTRIILDFNHPFAGFDLRYRGKIIGRPSEGIAFAETIMRTFGVVPDSITQEGEWLQVQLPDKLRYSQHWLLPLKFKVAGTLRKAGFEKIRLVETYVEEKEDVHQQKPNNPTAKSN